MSDAERQGAVMEVGMRNAGLEKVSVFQHAGMKFRIVDAGPDKGWGADPADSKGAVLECGAVEVCVLRQTIDVHLVKIGLPEKLRRKACLGRFVKQLLIDDFQGTTNAIIKSPEPIRLAAALAVRPLPL